MTARRVALASLTIIAAATGCGVTMDEAPRALSTTSSIAPLPEQPGASPGTATAELYFVSDDRLVLVTRALEDTSFQNALASIQAGPTQREADGSIRTAIPEGTQIEADLQDGLLQVALAGPLVSLRSDEYRRAIAQIVLTTSSSPGVERFRFTDDNGVSLAIPTDDGDAEEVTQCEFASALASDETAAETVSRADAERHSAARQRLEADCP